MKKITKGIISMVLIFALCCVQIVIVTASEDSTISTEAIYDLEKGGVQKFEILDKNGDILDVLIEEMPGKSKIENGSYKVELTSKGCWKAGFNVEISGNKFTRVYSPYHATLIGTIKYEKFSVITSTQISYNFTYVINAVRINTGVKAVMSGSSLKVSQI